jgi:orotate phosphoribosyltransferase
VGFFVRGGGKQPGRRRGVGARVERGARGPGARDTVTTGGSTAKAIERIVGQGLEVAAVVGVVDRLAGGGERIEAAAAAPYRALVTIDEIYPGRPDRD